MSENKVSFEAEYKTTADGRSMEYVFSDDLGTHVAVSQYIRSDWQLGEPEIRVDKLYHGESNEHVDARVAAINVAYNLRNEWSADTGKRWNGERVVEEEVKMIDEIKIQSYFEASLKGRRMDYVVYGDAVSVIWVVQNIDYDKHLIEPSLNAENISQGTDIDYVRNFSAALIQAADTFEKWSTDVGKRWDGRTVMDSAPLQLSDQIAALPTVKNIGYFECQSLMRSRAADLAAKFEKGITEAMLATADKNLAVAIAAKAYRDGKPLAECICEMMLYLAEATNADTGKSDLGIGPSQIIHCNIISPDVMGELARYMSKSPTVDIDEKILATDSLVVIVSDSVARLKIAMEMFMDGVKNAKATDRWCFGIDTVRTVQLDKRVMFVRHHEQMLGLTAGNLTFVVDRDRDYSFEMIESLIFYGKMFESQKSATFNAEMQRLGLAASAKVAE